MKILLVQATAFLPTWGGANKSNRIVLEHLAHRGHDCFLVAPCIGAQACSTLDQYQMELGRRGIECLAAQNELDLLLWNGVRIFALKAPGRSASLLRTIIQQVRPDRVLVASEDPGQVLLKAALQANAPVVYLARTTSALPFGPASVIVNPTGAVLLTQVSGIVVVSQYLKEYFRRWANLESTELPICPNGPGPFPRLAKFDSGYVVMVNPCAYKGIDLFVELASRFPQIEFAAVPSWGTTTKDQSLLASIPNISLIEPSDDIDDILRATRVLLVPSLWAEAKANMITEAMLRGIPVLASDVGGNSEALLGLDYLLPVNPIVSFESQLDEKMLPVAKMPRQDVSPWARALETLLCNQGVYRALSDKCYSLSARSNIMQDVSGLETYLAHIQSMIISTG